MSYIVITGVYDRIACRHLHVCAYNFRPDTTAEARKWMVISLKVCCIPLRKLEAIQPKNYNHIDICKESLQDTFTWWLRNREATANMMVKTEDTEFSIQSNVGLSKEKLYVSLV